MKHFPLFALIMAAMLMAGCGKQAATPPTTKAKAVDSGDSTIYGLVCDGSSDSILVFLPDPYDGSDPDTLDILDASRHHHVFGRLYVGDRVAILRDSTNSNQASVVIVTQDLQGPWCYKVKPRLRSRSVMESDSLTQDIWDLPDSSREQLLVEREYGFNLKTDSVAMPIGMRQAHADEDSPIEYPPLKRYRQWYIRNGRLHLVETSIDTLGNMKPIATDTAELVELTPDTLVLRLPDGLHGYYRKTENELNQ